MLAIFENRLIWAILLSWLVAQGAKFTQHRLRKRKWDLTLLWSASGMPSSHSAAVSASAVYVGLAQGFDSVLFGLSFVFAMIVMYDAMGVRQSVGHQAEVLNYLLELRDKDDQYDHLLCERVGHTPKQVAVGVLLGLLMGMLLYYV